jgi:hypothetical protein
MSDSLDIDEVDALLRNMGHVAQRCDTMMNALASAWRGVDLPRGCDLSGLATALRCLQSIRASTASQGKSLFDTVTEATKADKTWGDHVKGWLTPPKTGVHLLDGVLGTPGSAAAGFTDAGYDLGKGAVGLVWDVVDIPGDVTAYQHGDPMPIQKPGLGFINMGAHPLDTAKSMVGFQYKDDPTRMGAYTIGNVLAMLATGGLGEAAEGGLAARLAKLTEEGGTTSKALSQTIEDLERRRAEMPSSRQRSPGKRDYIRHRKASIDKDIQRARDALKAHEDHMAKVTDRYGRLSKIRNNKWVTGFSDATGFYLPRGVNKVVNWIRKTDGKVDDFAKGVWDKYVELQGYAMGSSDYTEAREARQRLAEFQADHPGRNLWPTR